MSRKPCNANAGTTPAAQGFRMPAEWERHAATWLAWPHNESDWPGKLAAIDWVYAEIVRHITRGELVHLIVNDANHEAHARSVLSRAGVMRSRVTFFHWPTNRGWTRDFGPIFVKRSAELAVLGLRFNAWAKYDDFELDAQIAAKAAQRLDLPLLPIAHDGQPIVLEGGAIEVNGDGIVITTEECMLDQETQVRNPSVGRAAMETLLNDALGTSRVIWLGRGIAGDDTHGHVDDLCRLVNSRTVVRCQEDNEQDENHAPLRENAERLEGTGLDVVALPMPAPLYFDGVRLPASYANFYICNAAVLVPTFNDPNDRVALGILGELFTDRPVIGIHAVDLVWGFGTLHCLTQQQPVVD